MISQTQPLIQNNHKSKIEAVMPIDESWKANIATIQVDYNQVTPITLGAKIS